ncbi:MAG: hypothetical protein ACR2PX_04520 [Endozoicomonas sp.]|uniref:hypothetical protein n=1 Tax=Endozoicomonas sp. TaxID=1892382 RepID=UPI003D9B3EC0
MLRVVLAVCVIYGLWNWWSERPVPHGPGVLAPDDPIQTQLSDSEVFSYKDYQVQPLADFKVQARVLGTEYYYAGREADLSPMDLALGWGSMSDSSVLDLVDISQRNRFYYWRVQQFPIPREQIETSSANMHMIPSSPEIKDLLSSLRVGQVVTLKGRLVEVSGQGGWQWKSSLSRDDTGKGACELLWVESVAVRLD